MSDEERQAEPAPEGSQCAAHPERAALVTCPRCGDYSCLACWHGAVNRCHACLLRDPMPPVPWADDELSWPRRFFGTLGDALRPAASSPRFARGVWTRGISFLLITFLPLALLSGIVPFTHHLAFGDGFGVQVLHDATSTQLATDITQAMGLGLLFGAVKLICLGVPFLSLTRAYGRRDLESEPARQVLLYRGWLLTLGGHGGLLLGIVMWGLPLAGADALGETTLGLLQALSLLPLLVLLWSMTSTARIAGVGPLAAMVVVIVPFLAMMFAEPLVIELVEPWLPDPAAVQQALEAT